MGEVFLCAADELASGGTALAGCCWGHRHWSRDKRAVVAVGSSEQIVLMPSGRHLPGSLGGFFPASLRTHEGKKKKKRARFS